MREIYFEPAIGQEYFYIDYSNFVINRRIVYSEGAGVKNYKIGNIYRTRKEAESVLALRQHVVAINKKYGRPTANVYMLDFCDFKWYIEIIKYDLFNKTLINREDIVHLSSTPSERAERLKLIQAVYDERWTQEENHEIYD